MPCYGPDGPPNLRSDVAEAELRRVQKQLLEATRAACDLLKLMPGFSDGAWDRIPSSTIKWCKEHRELDRKRMQKKGK